MAYGFTYTLPTITGTHVNFPVLLKTADFPATSIDASANAFANGGGDIKAYTSSAKTTQLAIQVVRFVSSATVPSAEVWIKVPSAATGGTIYLEKDAVQTVQPAVTDTYGRNAVWADYECVLHLNEASGNGTLDEFVDSTGNGYDAHLTTGTSISGTTVDHPFGGSWLDFTQAEALTLPGSASMLDGGDITMSFIGYFDTVSQTNGVFGNRWSSPDTHWHQMMSMGSLSSKTTGTEDNVQGDFFPSGAVFYAQMTHNSTSLRKWENGVNTVSDTTGIAVTAGITGTTDFRIGTYYDNNSTSDRLDGRLGEVRARKSELSADWISTEYENQSAATAWGTVGTWENSVTSYGFTYVLPGIKGTHTDFPIVLKTADFPAASIDAGANSFTTGGGEIKAYTSNAKTTQLAIQVVRLVSSATVPDAEVWVKVPSAYTGATIYLEKDAVQTAQPAVTDPYGRNAVWSDYECVLHLNEASGNGTVGEFVDSTGNGYDGQLTTGGTITGVSTNHPFGGTWLDFSSHAITLAGSASMLDGGDVTLSYMAHFDTVSSSHGVWGNRGSSPDNNWHHMMSSGKVFSDNGTQNDEYLPVPLNPSGVVQYVQMTHTSTTLSMYVDGNLSGTNTDTPVATGIVGALPYRIGTYYSNGSGFRADGRIGEVRGRKAALSADWIHTERDNYSSVDAWGVVGTWAIGGPAPSIPTTPTTSITDRSWTATATGARKSAQAGYIDPVYFANHQNHKGCAIFEVSEAGNVDFYVERVLGETGSIATTVTTFDVFTGGAHSGYHYTPVSQVITFTDGEIGWKKVTIPVNAIPTGFGVIGIKLSNYIPDGTGTARNEYCYIFLQGTGHAPGAKYLNSLGSGVESNGDISGTGAVGDPWRNPSHAATQMSIGGGVLYVSSAGGNYQDSGANKSVGNGAFVFENACGVSNPLICLPHPDNVTPVLVDNGLGDTYTAVGRFPGGYSPYLSKHHGIRFGTISSHIWLVGINTRHGGIFGEPALTNGIHHIVLWKLESRWAAFEGSNVMNIRFDSSHDCIYDSCIAAEAYTYEGGGGSVIWPSDTPGAHYGTIVDMNQQGNIQSFHSYGMRVIGCTTDIGEYGVMQKNAPGTGGFNVGHFTYVVKHCLFKRTKSTAVYFTNGGSGSPPTLKAVVGYCVADGNTRNGVGSQVSIVGVYMDGPSSTQSDRVDVYNCVNRLNGFIGNRECNGVRYWNNISEDASSEQYSSEQDGTWTARLEYGDYCLYVRGSAQRRTHVFGTTQTYATLVAWQAVTTASDDQVLMNGPDTNSTETATTPTYADAAAFDYRYANTLGYAGKAVGLDFMTVGSDVVIVWPSSETSGSLAVRAAVRSAVRNAVR